MFGKLARTAKAVVSRSKLLALAVVGGTLGLLSINAPARATDAALPDYTAVITATGNAVYPVLIPIMIFGIGLFVLWFVYRTIKSTAGRKGH